MDVIKTISGSEAAFRVLFTHATVGIIIVNRSGTIVLANHFASNMMGYVETELLGKDLSVLVSRNISDKHKAHIASYISNPVSRPMGACLELKSVKKDGTEFYVEISLCSYMADDERLVVAFITDITKQKMYKENLELLIKERTEELNTALAREKQQSELKSRFVSLASHEFRTPLSTILSSNSLINRYNETIGMDNIQKHTSRIKASVDNLTHLLNDFLSLDKLEQGIIQVHKENFSIQDLVADICDELENYVKQGQVINHRHEGNDSFSSDKKLLRNILLNLVSNASKYSEEHKHIFLETVLRDATLQIKITDQGIGIPAEEQEKLFTLFFRASNVGCVQGTGLGLNIVSKYASLIGAEISVSSIVNKGTTFVITLPSA